MVDMRDLSQVFEHEHADLPDPGQKASKRVGKPEMYYKKKTINLN
jgi:hypothetical protein